MKPNGFSENQTKAKKPDIDIDKETDIDIDKDTDIDTEKEIEKEIDTVMVEEKEEDNDSRPCRLRRPCRRVSGVFFFQIVVGGENILRLSFKGALSLILRYG